MKILDPKESQRAKARRQLVADNVEVLSRRLEANRYGTADKALFHTLKVLILQMNKDLDDAETAAALWEDRAGR